MTRRRTRPMRPGFATIAALALVALVGLALLSMTARLKDEADRTRGLVTEAQLRQMLRIGARAAGPMVRALPATDPTRTQNVALPPELENAGAALTLHATPGESRFGRYVLVTARLGDRTMTQRLRYLMANDVWGLVEAELEE